MRRLLVFLLVFGAGLALLLFFVDRQDQEKQRRAELGQAQLEPEREITNPFLEADDAEAEAPLDPPQDEGEPGDGPRIDLAFRGRVRGWVPDDEGRRLYEFDLTDVRPGAEGQYSVDRPELRMLDVTDGELETSIRASEAAMTIRARGGGAAIAEGIPIRLTEATVRMERGGPIAPVTLELPEATYDLEGRRLESATNVRVLGDGLFGTGNGLVASREEERLELLRDGLLRLRTDEGTQVELRALGEGSIALRRAGGREGAERAEVRLADGGELVALGEQEVRVRGDSIALDGRVVETGEDIEAEGGGSRPRRAFLPEYAKVTGGVSFTRDEETLTGGWAELFFDGAGSVQRVRVYEDPVARGRVALGEGPEAEPVEVTLSGLGPMELVYSAESPLAELGLPGPATLEVTGAALRLEASDRIQGEFWGRGLARLSLRGEVAGEYEGTLLEGRDIDVRGSDLEGAERQVLLGTAAPSVISGTTDEGQPYRAEVAGALSLLLAEDTPRIVEARDLTLTLGEEGAWVLEAAEVRDLVPASRSFTAAGGVTYSTPEGAGGAERAVGHSQEHLELFGGPERPATFALDAERARTLDLATLAAERIDVRPGRVVAQQQAELRIEDESQRVEVDADWFELRLPEGRQLDRPTPVEFTARELRRTELSGEGSVTSFLASSIEGRGTLLERGDGSTELELEELRAEEEVQLRYEGEAGRFDASGARVRWSPGAAARLEADPGERVEARGRFQAEGLPYVLSANWIEYRDESLQALYPELTLDRPAALPGPLAGRTAVDLHEGSAEWLTADATGVLLAGAARFDGVGQDGERVELAAGSMHLLRSEEGPERTQGVEDLVAWDGFELTVEGRYRGTGEVLELGYSVLRLEGRPARVEVAGFVFESDNIVYDVPRVLITTDQGLLRGAPGTSAEGWTARYESLQPFETDDQTMMVMRSPLMRSAGQELRGEWATLWLDRDEWLEKTRLWLSDEEAPRPEVPAVAEPVAAEEPQAPTLFGRFDASEASRVFKELYLEGGIEYSVDGERKALMDALYVDLALGHGWIQGAELFVDASAGSLQSRLAVRAEWLRHSADGTLHADEAEVTSCGFAEPHYFVRTRNLRLTPARDKESVWDVLLEDNAVVFDNGLSVPLPRVHYKSDGKGRPTFGGIRAGNSARFGSFVEAQIDVDVSDAVANTVAPLLGASGDEVDSSYGVRASYYGNRGLLLDQRFKVTAGDHFWMNTYLDGIYDQGEDRGFLRYKEDDSGELRWQLWSVGRYGIDEGEWLDLQYSKQSDPGFQAEFEESQFVRYERRDTFLRWRRADGSVYSSAIARLRSDDFRDEVERLPDAAIVKGLSPLEKLWGQQLLYTGSADAGYLLLRQGDELPSSPFDPQLDPALGNRQYLRADTRHRLEAPFDTKLAGIRLSPFVALAGTAWSEGVQDQDAPLRAAALAGIEARTTLFSTWRHGVVNTVMPFVGFRGELATVEEGDTPIRVDPRDGPLEGNIADVGIRSRWRVPGGARYLDLSIRASHAQDTAPGEAEGWLPARVLGEYLAAFGDVPFSLMHDGLYDLDDGSVPLSVTSLSVLPRPDLGLELSYNRGLDSANEVLFDAVGFGARWDASRKWQLEGRQTVSRLDSAPLSTNVVVRRLGHDFVFEVVYGFRSGEGGNSIAFRYRPLLGWRPPSFGNMQVLQRARL